MGLILPLRAASSPRVSPSFQKLSSLSTDDAILSKTFRTRDDQPDKEREKHLRSCNERKSIANVYLVKVI